MGENMDPELIVLDVAHGNCAIMVGEDSVVVVDAPQGGIHVDTLKTRGIRQVHAIVISHADADHMQGVTTLLYDEQIRVHKIYMNADPTKTAAARGLVWRNFLVAVADAVRRGEVTICGIKRGDEIKMVNQRIRLEVLAPTVDMVLCGPGGRLEGRTLTSNSLSAVLRVWFEEQPLAVLAADLDELGLQRLLREEDELHARVLVFPHHGGRTGGDDHSFASTIMNAVDPETVVFSFGREKYNNPRPQIVDAIRSANPDARIMCTQLSKRCSDSTFDPPHLAPLPARGRDSGQCCAGSLQLAPHGVVAPQVAGHAAFVDSLTPPPLCRIPVTTPTA